MTEAEWMSCRDPTPMLGFVSGNGSNRKTQLFACGCARNVWSLLGERDRSMVQVVEAHADGISLRLPSYARHSGDPFTRVNFPDLRTSSVLLASVVRAAADCAESHVSRSFVPGFPPIGESRRSAERYVQADLVHCVFGNPFRPVTIDPSWLTSTVLALGAGIYEDRAFDRLPILADALEDAGCDNTEILSHLRGDGPHVRGCWALDLILGKT